MSSLIVPPVDAMDIGRHWLTVAGAAAGLLAGAWCLTFARNYVQQLESQGAADLMCFVRAMRRSLRISRNADSTRLIDASKWYATGAILLAAGYAMLCTTRGLDGSVLGPAAAMLMLLALALIDVRTGLLPDALTYSLLGLGLAWAWAGFGPGLQIALYGALIGYGLLYGICRVAGRLFQKQILGGGDLKLYAALGAWLGPQALPWIMLAACASATLYAMWSQRTLSPRGSLAFGPFLAASGGAILALQPLLAAWTLR